MVVRQGYSFTGTKVSTLIQSGSVSGRCSGPPHNPGRVKRRKDCTQRGRDYFPLLVCLLCKRHQVSQPHSLFLSLLSLFRAQRTLRKSSYWYSVYFKCFLVIIIIIYFFMCAILQGRLKEEKKTRQAQSSFSICVLTGQISKSTMNFKGAERKKNKIRGSVWRLTDQRCVERSLSISQQALTWPPPERTTCPGFTLVGPAHSCKATSGGVGGWGVGGGRTKGWNIQLVCSKFSFSV